MAEIPETLDALRVPTSSLKPYSRNPRQGDIGAIVTSLQRHGQYRPIVVNARTQEVLAGNHTLAAALELGWTEIAATFVDADEDQAARIVLVDNRTNDLATYDDLELAKLLQELPDLEGTGFDGDDLDDLLAQLGDAAKREGHTDPDDVPPVPDEPAAATGQMWKLGDHRLVCGDSTDPDVLERLMAGRQADLLLTDPPYGVSYSAKANATGSTDHRDIANDELTGGALEDFLRAALGAAAAQMPEGAPAYVFHADTERVAVEAAMRAADVPPRQTLIWVKNRFVLGRQDYQWRHEPILYGWKSGAAHRWFGGFDKDNVFGDQAALEDPAKMRKDDLVALVTAIREQLETTVIECDRPSRSELHPTTKPVELLEQLMGNSARYGDAVLDPFGGSGSTLIACERTGRHAYLAELDPAYCDVIVRRWEEHTKRLAEPVDGS